MTRSGMDEHVHPGEPKLPRRDWILLPILGILTMLVLAASVEGIAIGMFPQLGVGPAGEDCMVFSDPATGSRGIPNCKIWEKIPEGELTQYRFNGDGFRADEEFGPKTPGTYRIVMVGESVALGMRVPREKTFGALIPQELSQETGRKVELFNESFPFTKPEAVAQHFNRALKFDPDMVLWAINSTDVHWHAGWDGRILSFSDGKDSFLVRAMRRVKGAFATQSPMDVARYLFRHTRTATLLQHFIYSSPSQTVRAALATGSDEYTSDQTLKMKEALKAFDQSVASIAAQAQSAGVPLVVVMLPNHAEAAMISMDDLPPGVDPYRLDQDARSIVTSHGGIYLDIFPDARAHPDLVRGFFNAEGHPNPLGHAIFAEMITHELTGGAVPALQVNAHARSQMELRSAGR